MSDCRRGLPAKRAAVVALVAAATTMIAGLVVPAQADAYRLAGKRWPGRTIPYYSSATQYAWSVNQAVAAWNGSGARIKFVRVTRKRAKMTIKVARPRSGESGSATMGYPGCAYWINGKCVRKQTSVVRLSPGWDRWSMAVIATHELGHVLGLDHENRRCAVMNSLGSAWGGQYCTDDFPEGRWRCRLIERDDARGAVRRYGGRAKAVRPDPLCWTHAPPPAPLELTATANPPSGASVLLQWRNSPGVPQGSKVQVSRGVGACPSSFEAGTPVGRTDQDPMTATPGSNSTLEDAGDPPLSSGRYCYAAWTTDENGQRGTAAVVWIDFVDTFGPPTEFVAVLNSASGATVELRWRNTTHHAAFDVRLVRRTGTCATDPNDPAATEITVFEPLEWGQPSYARLERPGNRPLTATRSGQFAARNTRAPRRRPS